MKILKRINRVLVIFHKVVIVIGCVALSALLIIIILNVFLRGFASHAAYLEKYYSSSVYTKIILALRSLLPSGISWMEEVSKDILFTAVTFIAMAIGVKLNLHINVNIIPKRAPRWFHVFLDKLRHILLLGVGLVFLYYGLSLFIISRGYLASIPGFPIAYQYVMIPVAGFCISVDSLFKLFKWENNEKQIDDFLMNAGENKAEKT